MDVGQLLTFDPCLCPEKMYKRKGKTKVLLKLSFSFSFAFSRAQGLRNRFSIGAGYEQNESKQEAPIVQNLFRDLCTHGQPVGNLPGRLLSIAPKVSSDPTLTMDEPLTTDQSPAGLLVRLLVGS